jgi:hypothetical protein
MRNITKTLIVIYDDYNNVLVIKRGKGGNNSSGAWSILGRDLKGKENEEKCITKLVDKDLGCTIFNLAPFKEYTIDEASDDSLLVYTGIIRERVTCHKTIKQVMWINEAKLDAYTFSPNEKKILTDFFKYHK